jgi:hypothetical protein
MIASLGGSIARRGDALSHAYQVTYQDRDMGRIRSREPLVSAMNVTRRPAGPSVCDGR